MGKNRSDLYSWFCSDYEFHQLYPVSIRHLAERHWTPLQAARKAAAFLGVEKQARVLDIGSGAGKFCLAAAWYRPLAHYFGVEQSLQMVQYAEKAKSILNLDNVHFIHANLLETDLKMYDHFYFYNSFYENLQPGEQRVSKLKANTRLYHLYANFLYGQLGEMRCGTRVATYYSPEQQLPTEYQLMGTEMKGLLNFYMKRR